MILFMKAKKFFKKTESSKQSWLPGIYYFYLMVQKCVEKTSIYILGGWDKEYLKIFGGWLK